MLLALAEMLQLFKSAFQSSVSVLGWQLGRSRFSLIRRGCLCWQQRLPPHTSAWSKALLTNPWRYNMTSDPNSADKAMTEQTKECNVHTNKGMQFPYKQRNAISMKEVLTCCSTPTAPTCNVDVESVHLIRTQVSRHATCNIRLPRYAFESSSVDVKILWFWWNRHRAIIPTSHLLHTKQRSALEGLLFSKESMGLWR